MLSDAKTYEQLKKEYPTASYKRKLVAVLARLKDKGKLSDDLSSRLYPTSEKIPRLYCLPKIHKEYVPFRPIADHTGSTGYNTSRFPADILNILIGQSEHIVKNSRQLAQDLSSVQMEEDELLVSYDVVSLFTSTPVKESLEVIREKLQRQPEWKYTTLLEVDDIMELLEFKLTTT